MRRPPWIGSLNGSSRHKPIRMALVQRRINRHLPRRNIQHQPQPRSAGQLTRQLQPLFGGAVETQIRMQPVKSGMDKDVATAPRLKRRGETDMAEAHRGDSREQGRPSLKRPSRKGVQMVYVGENPAIVH